MEAAPEPAQNLRLKDDPAHIEGKLANAEEEIRKLELKQKKLILANQELAAKNDDAVQCCDRLAENAKPQANDIESLHAQVSFTVHSTLRNAADSLQDGSRKSKSQ